MVKRAQAIQLQESWSPSDAADQRDLESKSVARWNPSCVADLDLSVRWGETPMAGRWAKEHGKELE